MPAIMVASAESGEGKTTTTVGLGDGLNRIGKRAAVKVISDTLSADTFAVRHEPFSADALMARLRDELTLTMQLNDAVQCFLREWSKVSVQRPSAISASAIARMRGAAAARASSRRIRSIARARSSS